MLQSVLKDDRYRLVVSRNGLPIKERSFHVYSSLCPVSNLGVVNATVGALEQAILERCFFISVNGVFQRPPQPVQGVYLEEGLMEFRRKVVEYVSPLATVGTLLQTALMYHGAKRVRYLEAYRSLGVEPLSRLDRKLLVFSKFEKADVGKAARVINPPSARYGLSLGKWLKPNEHLFFDGINQVWGGRTEATVMKGMDVYRTASVFRQKWDLFKHPVGVGLDATKLDACVSVPCLKYEHGFYTNTFQDNILAELLAWQLTSNSVGYVQDGRVNASFPGTRCSGDINTSQGNCLIVCALTYSFCVNFLNVFAELANNGDDCMLIVEREDLARLVKELPRWFLKRGFIMKVELPVSEFEQIEFCQSHPVWDGVCYRMVRNPVTCLQKDPMCLKPLSTSRALSKWRGAVGRGGLSLTSGIPVLQSFYSCLLKGTQRCTNRYFQNVVCSYSMRERGASLDTKRSIVTEEARASFSIAFGILPSEQVALEQYYDCHDLTDVVKLSTLAPVPLVAMASLVFTV